MAKSKQVFGLSKEDVKTLRDLKARVLGRGGSRRPVPTRRRPIGGGGSTLTFAVVTGAIGAGADGAAGTGMVQKKKVVDGALEDDGDPIAVANWHGISFSVGYRGYIDEGKSPPEAVVFSCVPAA